MVSAARRKMSVDKKIRHYHHSLKRSRNDPERMLHCLGKFQRMKVTVQHLQAKGLVRSVKKLGKEDGDVGTLARTLTSKWKQIMESSDDEKSKSHSSSSKHLIENTQENSIETKTERSHERSANRSKDERHRSHKHKHSSSEQHRKANEPHVSLSSSNKRVGDHDLNYSSDSKRQRCEEENSSENKTKSAEDAIEMDHSMGTSFADALEIIQPKSYPKTSTPSSTSGKSKSPTSGQISTPPKQKSPSSTKTKHKDEPKALMSTSTSSTKPTQLPTLLTNEIKLPPLLDITKALPPPAECIIPNYCKPSRVNPMIKECVYRQQNSKPNLFLNEATALCASITSKNIRTKVYSGVKSSKLSTVPSLHELCIRLLQKNIDALEYTVGIPFDILRPILERTTIQQLYTVEHYNPYLMEDSDVLWQQHCKQKFKSSKRLEMETWREMYTRCQQEQEDRLKSLTSNIKKSHSIAMPVRQTKLAYVDSAVKPPRNIVNRQHQFGTQNKMVATPAARTEALKSLAPNIAQIGDSRLQTTAAMSDTAQATKKSVAKPKKAPLMKKVLQQMKNRFKR